MNAFDEFLRIVQHLQNDQIEYALIGGVAMAFYAAPRFTRDIDILTSEHELGRIAEVLKREGYFESAEPWTFRESGLTLHRFLKTGGGDEMFIDVLVAQTPRQIDVIRHAVAASSEGTGVIRVASKGDLIWLKTLRDSTQDQADIERLTHEET
jgi:hypothetical protein